MKIIIQIKQTMKNLRFPSKSFQNLHILLQLIKMPQYTLYKKNYELRCYKCDLFKNFSSCAFNLKIP
jgi:hypothetical protein